MIVGDDELADGDGHGAATCATRRAGRGAARRSDRGVVANDGRTSHVSDDAHRTVRGELRAERRRARRSSVCGWVAQPARARRAPRVPRRARPHRHRAVRRRRRRTTCAPSTSCASPAPCGPGPRARSTPNLPTGEVEVGDCTVEVLSTRPSRRRSRSTTASTSTRCVRLRYRYLDLRRERDAAQPARPRPTVNAAMRAAMERQGFVEVETPMLIASTPGGRARLRRAVAPAARARSTRCRRARSCSSSC